MNALPEEITLTVLSGPDKGLHKKFEHDVIVLGREAECDFALTRDSAVSSEHALLVRDENTWTVKDLRSKNGVYVEVSSEKKRVDKAAVIMPGQVLVLGKSRISVSLCVEHKHAENVARADQPVNVHAMAQDAHGGTTMLRITSAGERLKFQMISDGAIGTRHTLTYAPSDVQEVVARVRDIVLRSGRHDLVSQQGSRESHAGALHALGEFLSYHFLPARIREKLSNLKSAHVLLLLDPSVVHLPWELAVLGDVPLCLKFSVGRQVIVDNVSTIQPYRVASSSTRLLIVSTPTEDLPEAFTQAQDLFRWLRGNLPTFHLEFIAGARVERIPLLTRMDGSEIVYFVGHAESDERNPMNSGWLLKSGRVTCADFMNMKSPPSFIFANGCQTSCEIPREDAPLSQGLAYGMASNFILSGVSSYLGAFSDVEVWAAGLFARSFFRHLLKGESTGESVRLARQELRMLLGDNNLAWSTYVLYGNPSLRFRMIADVDAGD